MCVWLIVASLVVVFSTSVYLLLKRYFLRLYSTFTRIGLSGPGTTWFFGSSLEMKDYDSPLKCFEAWYNKYGPVFGYYEGLTPSMCISDPVLIREILGTHFDKFQDRTDCVPVLHWPENRSIMHLKGNEWKKARGLMSPAFNEKTLNLMIKDICTKTDEFVNKVQDVADNSDVDITDLCDRYALDSFTLSVFGIDFASLSNPDEITLQYIRSYYMSGNVEDKLTGLSRLFPAFKIIKYLAMGDYRNLLYKNLQALREHIELMRQTYFKDESTAQHKIMEKLFNASETQAQKYLTETELIEHFNSILGSAYGQTNALLGYCIHMMAVRQDIQTKLRDEIADVIGSSTDIGMAELSQLKYMGMFLEETLRYYPIAPGVARVCNQTCTVRGIMIPKETVIRVIFTNMYTDPRIYPNPDVFDPLRFTPEEKAKRHPQTWLGFGYGPRMCVGSKLGLAQCKVALIKLIQKFEIHKSALTPDRLETSLRPMLLPKHGVHVALHQRFSKHTDERMYENEE